MDISEFKQSITNILSIDVETFEYDDKSPNPFTNDLKGVGFGSNEASQIYLVYNEDNRSAIQELLSLPIPKLGHNIKFDVITLKRHGFDVAGELEDSYILAKCFGYYEKTALKDMVEQLFNIKSPKITELINKYKQAKDKVK